MSDETIHIEVYFKKHEDIPYIGYEIEDKDDTILFSAFILEDCLHQFGRAEKKKEILFISSAELKERFKLMKKNFLVIPNNIDYKINCLIKYIEKNEEYYYGIRTIYLV